MENVELKQNPHCERRDQSTSVLQVLNEVELANLMFMGPCIIFIVE